MHNRLLLLLPRKEVALALGISLRSVDHLIARRLLPTRRVGRRVLVPVTAIEKFAKEDHPFPLTTKSQETVETHE
jgi:excisionase family DNA binding protein